MKRLAFPLLALTALAAPATAEDDLTIGFAIAKSGWMEALSLIHISEPTRPY